MRSGFKNLPEAKTRAALLDVPCSVCPPLEDVFFHHTSKGVGGWNIYDPVEGMAVPLREPVLAGHIFTDGVPLPVFRDLWDGTGGMMDVGGQPYLYYLIRDCWP